MTSIMSSPGGSTVYPNALSQLLGANQDTDTDPTGTTPATQAKTVPSLASVLSTDDTTGVGAQANSTITSLMMEIQALKSGASSTTGYSSATDGTQQTDPLQGGAVHGHHRHHGAGDADKASKAFAKIDTDKSGSVSLAEFLAGRPKDMSEDDATKIFKSIDTQGTGSISEDQFAANLKAEHGKAGAAHHAAGAEGADAKPDMKALAQDLVTQLKEVIQTFNNGYVDGADVNAPADTVAVG
ncbi:EF-hand domain-containing protein [Rhizobium sp. C4]|uniref:EF-hand domain-containing protein n=1 Tax=Rhizobium sp. C4 TaxID=1349800 RepID=UPI001E40A74B|nr:EF-hand domain-containing protein [Rhizobium sp. C4]MCD2173682.1 EF-hand domain-containing protein [Rhizobium sp. C4]